MEFSKASTLGTDFLQRGGQPSPGDVSNEGLNNSDMDKSRWRILKGDSYRNLSTVIVLPTPTDFIHNRVEGAIDGLMKPMNQAIAGPMRMSGQLPMEKIQVCGWEVGDAYNAAIKNIQGGDMKKWRFLLTVEHDNLPPPDGLLRLMNRMYENADKDEEGRIKEDKNGVLQFHFLGIGGLYWTKGFEQGQPMIYGNPKEFPRNYHPQLPVVDALQECNGIAMGFSIWNLSALMNDKRLAQPTWFETKNNWSPSTGVRAGTQDLVFCSKAAELGYKFAVDTSVKVGHFDFTTGMVF